MRARDSRIEHLLRRAGFGSSDAELGSYVELQFAAAVDLLLDYEQIVDDVDSFIGKTGYASVTARGGLQPDTIINDARQRWLFRMVHSERPLQEKMTLFWHNYFATAYTKIAGIYGGVEATRMMAAKPSATSRQTGQIEMLRAQALGSFRDILVAVAKDPAMLAWLDGRLNVRASPQENFGRELMELFSMGVGHYTEQDVYAAARVFTGWNLAVTGTRGDPLSYWDFRYNPGQHDTTAKTFTFPIYPDGRTTIPARAAADGMQDGLDLIDAVVRHPATPRRLARKLYAFFVSELEDPADSFIEALTATYYASNFSIRAMVRQILQSAEFSHSQSQFSRYAWPVEFVVRAVKEVGWIGFSLDSAVGPLTAMGQQLFEPPDVNGWELGRSWFTSGGMLARMNFASTLAQNQRFNLREAARPHGSSAAELLSYFIDRVTPAPLDGNVRAELLNYLAAGGPWTGSDAQLLSKSAGLVHLVTGMSEYQFN